MVLGGRPLFQTPPSSENHRQLAAHATAAKHTESAWRSGKNSHQSVSLHKKSQAIRITLAVLGGEPFKSMAVDVGQANWLELDDWHGRILPSPRDASQSYHTAEIALPATRTAILAVPYEPITSSLGNGPYHLKERCFPIDITRTHLRLVCRPATRSGLRHV